MRTLASSRLPSSQNMLQHPAHLRPGVASLPRPFSLSLGQHRAQQHAQAPAPARLRVQAGAGGGFDFAKLLGGRGAVKEDLLKDAERAEKLLWGKVVEKAAEAAAPEKLLVPEGAVDEAGFGKEQGGLTGGFPGGEKGLRKFLQDYPLPGEVPKELREAQRQLAAAAATAATGAPAPVPPPLLMPGMTVMVSNARDAYFQYTGIVQRITDGRVAVLFEGGNWDKLVTFNLTDLERTKKGPPGSNPKSGSLALNPLFAKKA